MLIDSECIGQQVNNYTVMLEWLEEELAASEADWKFVVGHRPIYRYDAMPFDTYVYL